MIPADALSRQHDHAIGIEDNEERIALPDGLFDRFMDLELQDAVANGLATDEATQEVLRRLKDPETQPMKWHLDKGADSQTCLFYDGKMYVPDNLALQ